MPRWCARAAASANRRDADARLAPQYQRPSAGLDPVEEPCNELGLGLSIEKRAIDLQRRADH
jgi:hypothetical protein